MNLQGRLIVVEVRSATFTTWHDRRTTNVKRNNLLNVELPSREYIAKAVALCIGHW